MSSIRFVIVLLILAIASTACVPAPAAPATPALEDLAAAVQQTLNFESAVKAQLTQAAADSLATAQALIPPTQEPPTAGPPQPTVYVTPSVPMLSVSYASNCREGPSAEIWRSIGGIQIGQKTEIVAVYNKGHWYIVKNPANPNERCWVWDFYATIEGDTSLLPRATVPATPTPKP